MNFGKISGVLLSVLLCSAIFAALATVSVTLLGSQSFRARNVSEKSLTPRSMLLGDPVPGGGIPCENKTGPG